MVNILKDVRSITHGEGESLEQKRYIFSIEAVPQTRLRYRFETKSVSNY